MFAVAVTSQNRRTKRIREGGRSDRVRGIVCGQEEMKRKTRSERTKRDVEMGYGYGGGSGATMFKRKKEGGGRVRKGWGAKRRMNGKREKERRKEH